MKTKFLKALIIDQDSAQARAMALLIKELFNQVYTVSTPEEVMDECKDLKAKVIFFNLNISQRTKSFEILEKLDLENSSQTLIFGYTDTHEPELFAHAIEEGISDIFVRPFDADIVATKTNKYFQFEKTQDREIGYTPVKPPLPAHMQIPLKIMVVDENGFQFRCDHYMSKGAQFKISDPLIREIFEDHSIDLMITKTWMGDNYGEYFFYAEPKSSGEKTSAALRRFILRKL